MNKRFFVFVLVVAALAIAVNMAYSDGQGNIRNTRHNFSATGAGGSPPTRNVVAVSETQVCIFCHTPHHAMTAAGPLWNHRMSSISNYTLYWTTTLLSYSGPTAIKPDGDSLLCLSCHDGDQPIGAVHVYGSAGFDQVITMTGSDLTASGKLKSGIAANFGADLSGHHPISIELNKCLANDKYDQCGAGTISFGVIVPTGTDEKNYMKPTSNTYPSSGGCSKGAPLGKGVQCSSCHDAHTANPFFLRVDVSSQTPWSSVAYSSNLCTVCHCQCGSNCIQY